MYINEIIRITYKCNWRCKFCNVWKVNNFGEKDVSHKEVIFQILSLAKKYTTEERANLVVSFSGGEPLLDQYLCNYIQLAKVVGIGKVQIQTNGSLLFNNVELLNSLIKSGLDEIFLSQHSHNDSVNRQLGCFYKFSHFIDWFRFLLKNKIEICIILNIVITKINLHSVLSFVQLLKGVGFLKYIDNKISFGFCQPNGYAVLHQKDVLLRFDDDEKNAINNIISFCKKESIELDFHYTSPPLCILYNPEYNLEYKKMREFHYDQKIGQHVQSNLDAFKVLWREKKKIEKCKKCKYDRFCLGFYKNWLNFVGGDFVNMQIDNFLSTHVGIIKD